MNELSKEVLALIQKRRGIRQYLDKTVETEKIQLLLEAGMSAPSACNLRPWEFIIVQGDGIKNLHACMGNGKYNAPMAMIVCVNNNILPWKGAGWNVDCGLAIENMMIAAVALDLGSVWVGDFRGEEVIKTFDIPEGVSPMAVIYFGYPEKMRKARTQYDEKAVHWGKYDVNRKRDGHVVDLDRIFNE